MSSKKPWETKKITARDVAEFAGVSVGTVSKALSGKGSVRYETRQNILRAANELGYRTNGFASGLSGRKTVGVITSDRFGRLTVPVLLGAIDTLSEQEIALLICDGRGDPIREQHFVDSFIERRVDGILVTGKSIASRESIGRDLGVPVVYSLAWSRHEGDVSVAPDDAQAARVATQHLISTGRRRIAYIGGTYDESSVRLTSVISELHANGLELVGQPLFGQWTERWGRQAAGLLLRSGEDFDGVICGNDQLGRGVLDTFHDKGIDVPGRVGVIGFDNWEAMVEASWPPLSTMDLSLQEVGRSAARLLLQAIYGAPADSGVLRIECRLVPRDSTAVS